MIHSMTEREAEDDEEDGAWARGGAGATRSVARAHLAWHLKP